MKTFVMAAIAATMVAGSAFAHPVNEPHICGIDPSTVMDWPASNWVSENTGQIYDKGDYFFIATNDNDGSGEYTTTHTRIWKDSMEHNGACRVVGTEIFHANDDSAVANNPFIQISLIDNGNGTWSLGFTYMGNSVMSDPIKGTPSGTDRDFVAAANSALANYEYGLDAETQDNLWNANSVDELDQELHRWASQNID